MKSLLLLAVLAGTAYAQNNYAPSVPPANGVLGYWSTNAGSVLLIDHCGDKVCITIETIAKTAPGVIDARNPNPALRSRPVCHLNIGTNFVLKDPDHADDGQVYDPESGRTYKATLYSQGNTLHLRGYVGFTLFGRTETWKRTAAQYATCEGTTRR